MNDLVIDGKKYISSKRAAEITKYSKDYVGQLARSGKIDARLVGRSWYIDQESILAHSERKTATPSYSTTTIRDEGAMPVVTHTEPEVSESLGMLTEDLTSNVDIHEKEVVDENIEPSIVANLQDDTAHAGMSADHDHVETMHNRESEEKVVERKIVGSNGWRSLWGIPVYESDNSDLIPLTTKHSSGIKDADWRQQSLGRTQEEIIEPTHDTAISEGVWPNPRLRKMSQPEQEISRIRVTKKATKNDTPIEYKYDDESKNTSGGKAPIALAGSVLLAIILFVAVMLSGSQMVGRSGKDQGSGGGIFSQSIHYSR
jgi:uncharacterized protein YbcI